VNVHEFLICGETSLINDLFHVQINDFLGNTGNGYAIICTFEIFVFDHFKK